MEAFLPLKACDARTGETRRWPAPARGVLGSLEAFVGKASTAFGFEPTLCFSYLDDQRDRILLDPSVASAGEEWKEAHRATSAAGGTCLSLKVYATKADALAEYARAAAPPPPPHGGLRLGPRPGRVVALDLGIPLKEARELVHRARRGDKIARRVVAPSSAFWLDLKRNGRESVLGRDELFAAAAPPPPPPQEPAPVRHMGIVCDGCDAAPIVGTRWHLLGHDFDLCEACKGRDQTSQPFVKIATPGDARRAITEAVAASEAANAANAAKAAEESAAAAVAAEDDALQKAVALSLQDIASMSVEDDRTPPEEATAEPYSPAPPSLESFPGLESDDESAVLVEALQNP